MTLEGADVVGAAEDDGPTPPPPDASVNTDAHGRSSLSGMTVDFDGAKNSFHHFSSANSDGSIDEPRLLKGSDASNR